MKQKFKLLKAIPECRAGTEGYRQDGNVVFESVIASPKREGIRYVSYPIKFVLEETNWFKEVPFLSPCPCCGGKAEINHIQEEGTHKHEIHCKDCLLTICKRGYDAVYRVYACWNHRV